MEDQCRIWETDPDNLGELAYMLSCCLIKLVSVVFEKGRGSGDGLVGGGGCVLLITYHSMSIATEQEFCGINCDREVPKPFYYYFVLKFVIPGLFLLFFKTTQIY